MALTNKLTNIAEAIRNKTGKSDLLTLDTMVTEIESIQTGGGEFEPVVLSGNCSYSCSNTGWNQFFSFVSTKDIDSAASMFYENRVLTSVPFTINFKANSYGNDTNYMFNYCTNLKTIPKISGFKIGNMSGMFSGCYYLNDDLDSKISCEGFGGNTSPNVDSLFNGCYSLRKAPMNFINVLNRGYLGNYYWSSPAATQFTYCYALDEINGYYPVNSVVDSNMFSSTFDYCGRLKDFTFEVQEDGTPYSRNWSFQTINLVNYIGYERQNTYIINYKSGINSSTQVYDAATYQALKDNPDWWTTNISYSRYNHDSAVNTINSLPDVTSGSGNTIKFKKASGSLTDGGAINTLTEEEIAVAAAKGWTVTLS